MPAHNLWWSLLCAVLVWAFRLQGAEPELLARAERLIQQERFEAAEPLLLKASRADPANVEVQYRLAYVWYRQRRLAEAAIAFERIVRTAPPALHSRYFLGRIAIVGNRNADAIRWLEPVVASGQRVFEASSQLAKAYVAVGQPRRALRALDAAIREAPWDGALYYRQARIHEQLGEAALAKAAFANSRRLMSAGRETVALLLECSNILSKGATTEAVQACDELLKRDADPQALTALGVLYAGAGAHEQALRVFRLAIHREPSLFQAQYNAGLALLKLGRVQEARPPLEAAASLLPQSPDLNSALGLLNVMEQRYSDAVPFLEKALDWDNAGSRVPGVLGLAYLRSGNPAKAAATLQKLISVSPDDPKSYFALVEAQNKMEREQDGLTTAQEAQRRFPHVPDAHLALAQQLARLGRYQEAGPAFARALELAPGRPEPMLGLADVLEKRGEYENSLALYERAARFPAAGVTARLGTARNLVALRRFDQARGILESALRTNPDDPQVRFELSRVYARLGRKEEAAEQARISQELRSRENPKTPQ